MPWCVPFWVQFLWDSLGFLDFLEVYFLHQIGEAFLHYLFKLVFNFLLLFFSFCHSYDSDVGTFQVVPEVPKSLFIFFEFLFLYSVLVGCLFLPFVPNNWFEPWFSSCHCWLPEYFAFFHFGPISLFRAPVKF